ncbi:MAG: hypothetical protein Q8Q20_02215, partial [bacterium]|nr:hypothetical protein [bacterium]
QTAGAQANLEIKDVAEPKRIQELITRLQTETVAPPKDLSAAELVKMVDTIKEGLGEEHFNRLLKDSPKSSLKPKSRRSQ